MDKVRKVSYWRNGVYLASLTLTKAFDALGRDPGLAVCESYNMLKGNPRGKANPPQKFSDGGFAGILVGAKYE